MQQACLSAYVWLFPLIESLPLMYVDWVGWVLSEVAVAFVRPASVRGRPFLLRKDAKFYQRPSWKERRESCKHFTPFLLQALLATENKKAPAGSMSGSSQVLAVRVQLRKMQFINNSGWLEKSCWDCPADHSIEFSGRQWPAVLRGVKL